MVEPAFAGDDDVDLHQSIIELAPLGDAARARQRVDLLGSHAQRHPQLVLA